MRKKLKTEAAFFAPKKGWYSVHVGKFNKKGKLTILVTSFDEKPLKKGGENGKN